MSVTTEPIKGQEIQLDVPDKTYWRSSADN